MTPAMQQYSQIKSEYPDYIVLFRMGDFYETFYEDAIKSSTILNIALTARDREKKVPMAGIPFHALDTYLSKLIKANQRVVIVEQLEDPKEAKGVVKRGIARIVTPGTADLDLEEKKNNYLLVVDLDQSRYEISYLDILEGIIFYDEFTSFEELLNSLLLNSPREVLVLESHFDSDSSEKIQEHFGEKLNFIGTKFISDLNYEKYLTKDFKSKYSSFSNSTIILLNYLSHTHRTELGHVHSLKKITRTNNINLSSVTVQNLELIEGLRQDSISLFYVMDECKTISGSKLLKKWLISPLINIDEIKERQDLVEQFRMKDPKAIYELREILSTIYDLNRICSRIGLMNANARDLRNLVYTLRRVYDFTVELSRISVNSNQIEIKVGHLLELLNQSKEILDKIDNTITDNPPLTVRDGGIIREGIDKELDDLISLRDGGQKWLQMFEKNEIERTRINTLKVRFNKIFGFYIEVSKGNISKVPEDYIKKQTLVNAERFITPELKRHENDILSADSKIKKIEFELFSKILKEAQLIIRPLQEISEIISFLDVIITFEELSNKYNWIKPEVNDSLVINISKGRHPVIEFLLQKEGKQFVSNDLTINDSNSLLLITGPNMGGKSTFIRQNSIIVLLSQVGSFVPADSAQIGIVDNIFTRVGASDNLSRGESTFMVEMIETASILQNASERSLVILDEVGRGTSTFDGISLAWAISEKLIKIGARTLFATHYHELTELANKYTNVKNLSIKVSEYNDEIVFLHKIQSGKVDKSYGIHVAKLAGLPKDVITVSYKILKLLEKEKVKLSPQPQGLFSTQDNTLSKKNNNEIITFLEKIDVNTLTPLQSLDLLSQLKEMARKHSSENSIG